MNAGADDGAMMKIAPAIHIPTNTEFLATVGYIVLLREQIATMLRMSLSGVSEAPENQYYKDRGRNSEVINEIIKISEYKYLLEIKNAAIEFETKHGIAYKKSNKIAHGLFPSDDETFSQVMDAKDWQQVDVGDLKVLVQELATATHDARRIVFAVCAAIQAKQLSERPEGAGPHFRYEDRWFRL
ncbi:MAG: hypothetical protein ACK4NO_02650 [Glycocaulis sp.]